LEQRAPLGDAAFAGTTFDPFVRAPFAFKPHTVIT